MENLNAEETDILIEGDPNRHIEQEDLTFEEKYDRVLGETGGFGWFQMLTVSGFYCGMWSGSWVIYGLTFYELMPKFLCRSTLKGAWESCKPADFC